MQDIPADVLVARTPALDATRHLAPGGRYWRRMAIPDAWASWWLTAVPRGLQLIARHQVDAIWSTYPIATAHRIGATLARLTDRPWVADFRDPMVEHFPETGETFPKDPALRNARLKIEALTAQRAAGAVFCTDSARLIFAERHGAFPRENLDVIPNGYEEGMFDAAVRKPRAGPRVLLHSGTIYPGMDRDPSQLFCALGRLAARGMISPQDFELRLRDPGNVDHFRKLAADHGVEALVSFAGPLPYREALAEMCNADALLVLQGLTSNPAVPAKLYEYLRAGRPVIALVHPAGETARTLHRVGIDSMADLTDAGAIAALVSRWLMDPTRLEAGLPSAGMVRAYSREALTGQLAARLDQLVESQPARRPA